MFETCIKVKTQFTATHSWPGAQGRHEYLNHPHRHVFHVSVVASVFHDDRELEYFEVLDKIENFIDAHFADKRSVHSCEMFARAIAEYIMGLYGNDRLYQVEVSEDGENGSIVRWTP